MKKLIGVCLLSTLILFGCSNNKRDFSYVYSGENNDWVVTYEVYSKGVSPKKTDESKNVLKLQYKGNDEQQKLVNNVEVKLESSATLMEFVQNDFSVNTDKVLESEVCKTESPIEDRYESITVSVKINDKNETIELTSFN